MATFYPEKSLNMLTFFPARVTPRTNALHGGRKRGPSPSSGNLPGCERMVNHYREFRFEHVYYLI
jgi:hypothetical protein